LTWTSEIEFGDGQEWGVDMDIAGKPFNALLGITADKDSCDVRLACTAEHHNHLGAAHAGVVFAVAEAASGRYLIENLSKWQGKALAVLRSASIKYRKPAHGTLVGIGEVSADALGVFVRRLEQRGRAEMEVHVSVRVEEEVVFTGMFAWFVSVAS
jgi:acyl-coenzyme A thioesterase PaaI-like protein